MRKPIHLPWCLIATGATYASALCAISRRLPRHVATGGDSGELIGVDGRQGWVMTVPFGMVPIPAGTFHMGQADEDPASTQINYNKQVTIGSFFMDDTEITNNEYRQFTNFYLVENSHSLFSL